MRTLLKQGLILSALFAVGAPSMAQAEPTGAQDCPVDTHAKLVYRTVHVPPYIANAQRGDVVLTAGGDGVPKALLNAIGQTYTHTLFVSQPLTTGGHTTFTHDTAIDLGEKSMDFDAVNVAPIRFKPMELSRMVPGNIIGDTANTLIHGKHEECLNSHSAATCVSMGARPENLWRASTLLVRPNNGAAAVNVAETWAPGSLLYSVGSYSDYNSALNATNQEANQGQGTMCSGFITAALNAVGVTVNPVLYSQSTREIAANALDTKVYDKLADSMTTLFALAIPLGRPDWFLLPRLMTNQVVNCFASGGACSDQSSWHGKVGTGTSISGDDLLADAQANGWATTQTATFGGDYDIQQFSHIECCRVNEYTGQETCSRYAPPLTPVRGDLEPIGPGAVSPGDGDLGDAPVSTRVEELAALPGEFVENGDEYCWVTEEGSACTPLEADQAQESAR